MYHFESRIRYSEVDSQGKATLNSVLDYFQDCSSFHSEDLGVGMGFLAERQAAWVLSSWQIEAERYPVHGERVVVSAWLYDFKGFFGCRMAQEYLPINLKLERCVQNTERQPFMGI